MIRFSHTDSISKLTNSVLIIQVEQVVKQDY